MIVMDKKEYSNMENKLLELNSTYCPVVVDVTNKHKAKPITLQIKAESGIDDNTYKHVYPTGECSPKFYGLPKIYKKGTPIGLYFSVEV